MRLPLPLLALSCCFAAGPDPSPSLDSAFDRLYNFDFAGSRDSADRYLAAHAGDPMGFTVKAAGLLYSELNRLDGLGGGVLSEEKVKNGKALKPDPLVRRDFFTALMEAQRLAKARLEKNPNDRDGLLVMSITAGLERDYLALIDKKLRQSFEAIKQSFAYSQRLLAVDPAAHDAYLNTGFTEYLLGSFPAVLRWLVKIEGVEGNKQKGLDLMEVAARSGKWMRPFAQLMLASFYKKENRPQDSERMLREMARLYPRNAVIQREIAKLNGAA